MLGTLAALGIGAAANIGTSIIGRLASQGDRDKAQQALNEAFQQINEIGAPPDLSNEIIRQKLTQVGVYTPEMEQDIQQASSKLSQVKEDSTLRDAQTKALQVLQQRGAGGLTPEDRAAFNTLRTQAAKEAEGKRQQILQNMAARGMGGAGAELAAQLSTSQAGDEALSAAGDRISAAASERALQSMTNAGELGGRIRSQDFDVNKTRAAAEDELNRFNIQNQIARQERNTAAKNKAQQYNLGEQQRISDYNTAQENEERLRQASAKRQAYLDQLALSKAKADALSGRAQNFQSQAKSTEELAGGIGQGLGKLGTGVAAYNMEQDKLNNKQTPMSEDEWDTLKSNINKPLY